MSSKDLAKIVSIVKSGQKMSIPELVRDRPEIPALISKLVTATDKISSFDNSGNKNINTNNPAEFSKVSNEVAKKTTDAEGMLELFPELELSAQILISSIISPKDMSSTDINYSIPPGLKTSDISAILINEVKQYLTKDYKIEPLLPTILRKILFESGSYPVAVIPESSIDQIINSSSTAAAMESLKELTDLDKCTFKPIGIIGNSDNVSDNKKPSENKKAQDTTPNLNTSLESIDNRGISSLNNYNHYIDGFGKNLVVTDNFSILKLPTLFEVRRQVNIKNKIRGNTRLGVESADRMNDRSLSTLLFRSPNRNTINVVKVKTADESKRKTIGEPLIMVLPSESVIPVTVPGNEEDHVGYFVLLDMEGNPVNKANNSSGFDDLQSRLNSNGDASSFLLNKAKSVYGDNCTSLSLQQATQIYGDIVEADLLSRLRNGVIGKTLSVGKNEDVYRLMLARTLRAQFTQLLFIPAELMTYFAYKYDSKGVGKSLLDDLRILNSLRAMVLFSKVMAQLKNSIGRTNIDVQLDENDPMANKTMETIIHEVGKTRRSSFPIGLNSPGDLADWLQTSGMQFNFTNHPGLPNIQLKFSEENSSYVEPSTDLEDDLRKRSIMAIGLSPETVDNGYSGEFATSVVANNLLLTKRVMQIQEKIIPLLTDHIRKVLINNGNVVNKIKDLVSQNLEKLMPHFEGVEINDSNRDYLLDLLVQEFITNLEVSLPQPNNITLENQMAGFDAYVEALDKILPHYISSEILPPSLVGENANEKVEEIKQVVKAYFCRRWLAENGVLGELSELTSNDEKGDPLINLADIQKNHNNSIIQSMVGLFNIAKPTITAVNKDLENTGTSKIESADPVAPAPDSGDESSTGDSSSDSGIDLGIDDDLGLPKL